MAIYLHDHKDFPDLLRILEDKTGIQAGLIEKDYWIMHVLNALKLNKFEFELKGGTSLSKGYKIIERFSEDIDIHIKPDPSLNVEENPKKVKEKHVKSRKEYYDWLSENIKIDGIVSTKRDETFDNHVYTSGGIRLIYESHFPSIQGVKEGILLEVGFDNVTPNSQVLISSWAYDEAAKNSSISIIDNRALNINCYNPGYTFVEKLQTIVTKFRQEAKDGIEKPNYMRQYYDIYCLLDNQEVRKFIGTPEYEDHKCKRFPKVDLDTPLQFQEAFLLSDENLYNKFKARYLKTSQLYYLGQPSFDDVIKKIRENVHLF
jgi:hypothetical protein